MPIQLDTEDEIGIPTGEQNQIDSLNRAHSMPSPLRNREALNVEEELLERDRAEEEEREQEFEATQQLERQQALMQAEAERNFPANQASDTAKSAAKSYAKGLAKTAVKDAALEAGAAAAPVWGTILAIILALCGIIFVTLITIKWGCDSSYTDSIKVAGFKFAIAWLPGDVCAALETGNSTVATVPGSGGGGGGGSFEYDYGSTDATKRAFLAAAPRLITVNKADCTAGQVNNCTSLENTRSGVLDEMVNLSTACDSASRNESGSPGNACGVRITGGSEPGHAGGACSHANGYKVDISSSAAVTNYIHANFQSTGARGGDHGGERWINPQTNAEYVLESNPSHWDITVGC